MTENTGRACIRGCVVDGEHYAQCVDFGGGEGASCTGCAPVKAREGSMICGRCFGKLRGAIDQWPDCVASMASAADPEKAAQYGERVTGSRDQTPAPVRAEVIDAYWAVSAAIAYGVEQLTGAHGRMPRLTDPHNAAIGEAMGLASDVKRWLPEISNDASTVAWWWHLLLTQADDADLDAAERAWTLQRALSTFRVAPYTKRSQGLCPEASGGCGLKTVFVRQPRVAPGATEYRCRSCGWERDSDDVDGAWALVFEGVDVTEYADGAAA